MAPLNETHALQETGGGPSSAELRQQTAFTAESNAKRSKIHHIICADHELKLGTAPPKGCSMSRCGNTSHSHKTHAAFRQAPQPV